VQCEDRVGCGVLQDALLDHELGPALLTLGSPLLCRLEDEHDGAGEPIPDPAQHLGCAHEDRNMKIVTAGVHHPDFLAAVDRAHSGGEGKIYQLGDGQGVHVGTQSHHGSG
jgi:hypothetical protein